MREVLTRWDLLPFIPVLLLFEAFFSGSEMALLSCNRLNLNQKAQNGNRGAALALRLLQNPETILSTTLLITSFCVVSITSILTLFFMGLHPENGELLSIIVASPLIVILGELVPKTLFHRYSDRITPIISYPVTIMYLTCYPITKLLSYYSSYIGRFMSPIQTLFIGRKRTTRDDIRDLINSSKRETELKVSEKRMIRRILDFKDTEAKHALIPLVRVETIEDTATVGEALSAFEKHLHSRMPVYSERVDNMIGFIEAYDLFAAKDLRTQKIQSFIKPIHYLSETQNLEDVMIEMGVKRAEFCIVVDEHGGAVGILTLEDIVEEIVGNIEDEYDTHSPLHQVISPFRWMIQSKIELHQLNEELKLAIPDGDYETLSGFLLQQFGRIPQNGDELVFDTSAGTLRFVIRQATSRRIEKVEVENIRPKLSN